MGRGAARRGAARWGAVRRGAVRRGVALLALLAALALALGGCTGTSEVSAPLLLVTGIQDTSTTPAAPQLALVEDAYSPTQPTADRLRFVAGSRRDLPEPAVALDVRDRAGDRDVAAVLTRDLSGAAPASHLLFFDVAGIDPASPGAFAERTGERLELTGSPTALLRDDVLSGFGLPGGACPDAVQVSRDASIVAVLDARDACTPGDTLTNLFLIDRSGATPSVSVVASAAPVLPVPPYLDQGRLTEGLDFLVQGTSRAQVYRMVLPDGTPGQVGQLTLAYDPSNPLRDATGTGATYLAVGANRLLSVEVAANGAAGDVATVSDTRALAVDPTGATQQVMVLGATRTAVHATPTDGEPSELSVTGYGVALDPVNRFGYVSADGAMSIIDLLALPTTGSSASAVVTLPLPELTFPERSDGTPVTILGWARAALPTAP